MPSSDVPRTVLPIPERPHTGLVTYDAKDPDTSFPPIDRCARWPELATCYVIMIDVCGSRDGTEL